MTQLSPNFELREFVRSQIAARHDIDNTPPPAAVANLQMLCRQVLEPIRAQFGPLLITSGYRAPQVNKLAGGQPSSQHTTGEAADFECPGWPNLHVARWCEDHLKDFDQLILEFYRQGDPSSGWVHVSYKPIRNRRQIFTATRNSAGTVVYLPGIHP